MNKQELRAQFSKDWKTHYSLDFFKEKGFERKKCVVCGRNFWTLAPERKTCADSSCETYDFIGKKIGKRFDYVGTWKEFEKFFKKNGHESISRYPVLCRWRDDLYFTIASITDFQRVEAGKVTFEYPTDKLIVPQVCLRFQDVSNVGVTGRHLSGFVMAGQQSFGYPKTGYWKEECIRLNFELLTKTFGIPQEQLNYTEDVWTMPDFSALGPCIETYSNGAEIVNSVFMQYAHTGSGPGGGFQELDTKAIDVGWGHERLTWFLNGTPTIYDILGPAVDKIKKQIDFDKPLFEKYSRIAGTLDINEVGDIKKAKQTIAKKLGISVDELYKKIEPAQAAYAIADHARTVAFAVADGGLPSNSGGGYNLRVLLRRSLGFINEFEFGIGLEDVAELHAKYLKPMFPELLETQEQFKQVIEIESRKYREATERAKKQVTLLVGKGEKFDEKTLTTLYESQGITPELIEKVAADAGKRIEIPPAYYSRMTEKHEAIEPKVLKQEFDVAGLPKTVPLFYEDALEFDAKVLKTWKKGENNFVVLDRTAFYAESGGQHSDQGTLNGVAMVNAKRIEGVIVHELAGEIEEKTVHGKIDRARRTQLTKHHTAVHIVNGAARKVLGEHVWQAGAEKSFDKARLDITHYDALSPEQTERIERLANEIIAKKIPIKIQAWPRGEAERKYGFRIYQGGVPGREVRVIDIPGVDVEACGGTHLKNTGEAERIKILKTQKIQDGVVRIELVAGKALCEKAEQKSEQEQEHQKSAWLERAKRAEEELGSLRAKLKLQPKRIVLKDLPMEKLIEAWKSFSKEAEELKQKIGEKSSTEPIQFVPGADMKLLENVGRKIVGENPSGFAVLVSDGVVFGTRGPSCKTSIEREVREAARIMGGNAGGADKPGGEMKGGGPLKDKSREAFEFLKKAIKA